MLTSRKARPLIRDQGTLRDARLVVIATEGQVTEKLYFEEFGDSRVKVKIVPSVDGRSAPQHVLQNLVDYADTYQIGAGDQMWLLVDRDRWEPSALATVAAECDRKSWGFALSNPSFELWLCLHFEANLPPEPTQGDLESILREKLGSFNKSKYDVNLCLKDLSGAVARAEALDQTPASRWPNTTGTRVYRVVRAIRD